jgi:hypothetical protein
LFSAVVTAFVIESSQSLQPDYNQATALLTAQVLKALTNAGNLSYLASMPSAEQILSLTKSNLSTSVNILWFSALGFSLSAVLVAMLAKQWLAVYDSQSQDELLKASCERQRKFDGLHKWSLPYILAVLPALLHVSLFLFLAGLIIYLWNLDPTVSQTNCVILGLLFMFYFASGMLAVFNLNCPYQTPLSRFIHSYIWSAHKKHTPDDLIVPRAVMWLANTNDPKTVSVALQSLAGLRRGFRYKGEEAEYLARLSLEHLRTCFISEWRHGGTYNLRTEKQYEASCYLRTLMHFVDDPRNTDPSRFAAILADPALPTFMKLLGECAERSIALLALCDYQRLLHRIEIVSWPSVRSLGRAGNTRTAAQSVRHEDAEANVMEIIMLLNDYIKGRNFLHPFTVEVAVETMGYAPIPWVTKFSKTDSLRDYLAPLVRLLRLTRGGGIGVRRALARTFAILCQIHAIPIRPEPEDDFVAKVEYALSLSIASAVETSDGSDDEVREMLLLALSYFVAMFEQQEVLVQSFLDELFYECDMWVSIEQLPFSDKTTVSALLPLLLAPSLSHEHKANIMTRLYANAISAAGEVDPTQNSLTLPLDAFPPDAVSILIRTLDHFKGTTHSWLGDASILLYVISRGSSHRQLLLPQAHILIANVETAVHEEVANRLFWILTSLLWDAVNASDENIIQTLMSAGIVNMFNVYSEKYGLTPADAHAWADILTLPGDPSETASRRELTESLCSRFEGQDEERLQHLFRLREPILQFSYQYSTAYTPESALEALKALRKVYAEADTTSVSKPPDTGQEGPASPALPPEPTSLDVPPTQEARNGDDAGNSVSVQEEGLDGDEMGSYPTIQEGPHEEDKVD